MKDANGEKEEAQLILYLNQHHCSLLSSVTHPLFLEILQKLNGPHALLQMMLPTAQLPTVAPGLKVKN